MKTTIRFNRVATAKYELAALLCLAFVFAGCKKEAAPSAKKALFRTTVVESMENGRSDSKASHLGQVRAEEWLEPQRDRADNGGQLMAVENRTDIATLEREESLLVEAIIMAKTGSVLTVQTENIKKAVRALERATDRCELGVGTQIDVLNAQTALTEARRSYADALRNYSLARATLSRATGAHLQY